MQYRMDRFPAKLRDGEPASREVIDESANRVLAFGVTNAEVRSTHRDILLSLRDHFPPLVLSAWRVEVYRFYSPCGET